MAVATRPVATARTRKAVSMTDGGQLAPRLGFVRPGVGRGVAEGPDRPLPRTARDFTPLDEALVARLRRYTLASPSAEEFEVRAPATGDVLARLPISTPHDVRVAVDRARVAQTAWAAQPVRKRARVLLRFYDELLDHRDELLDLVQLETGKARMHAFEEIFDVAQAARYYARTAGRLLAPRRHAGAVPGLIQVTQIRHPKGVVGVVAPWNYPLSMGFTDLLPALVAGNAVVVRPDEKGSLTLLFALHLLARAGAPAGLAQAVLGPGPIVGGAVCEESDYVQFTGSTATGRQVARSLGKRLVGVSLELGGKNPMYVAEDASLDRAVEGAVRGAFTSSGQICVGIERLYLHREIAEEFLSRFLPAVRALRLGGDLEYGVDMGSLASPEQLATTARHVDDAVAKGATVLAGGRARPDLGPWFYEPTVLEGVTETMEVRRAETFGPVVSIYRVDGDGEAIRACNDSQFGLNASVWTRDVARGRKIAALLQAGSVNVNEAFAAAYASMAAPMGGMKNSGLGRRHGVEGLLKYTEPQAIAVQRLMGFNLPPRLRSPAGVAAVTASLRLRRWVGRG